MTYNVDLMLQVREQITAHPETHDQAHWAAKTACGTTMCIAGWATTLAGMKLVIDQDDDWIYLVEGPQGPQSIRETAGTLLGLDAREQIKLFAGGQGNALPLALLDRFIEAGKNGERVCLD
jgi:hypothetical protein